MRSDKILVIDDDRNFLEVVRIPLERANYSVVTASREEEGVEAARKEMPDLSIVDLQLTHQDGVSLMLHLHATAPDMPVIILTGHGSIESAVDAMRRGAYSYITKPVDHRELLLQVEKALEKGRLTSEIRRLQGLLEERWDVPNIIAKSPKMCQVLGLISQIAKTESTVFIQGESGTGKELIARAIHLSSHRKERAFVAVNCAAFPETLLESELFGYEKGAFTGAAQSKKGLLMQAHEGTFFFDEIGDMPPSTQAKILRVLQERQFYPVGGEKPCEVDVRLIVATNKNLEEQVRRGQFREDLFYRVHVIPVLLPPLRERREDIPFLARHFIERFSQQVKKDVVDLTPGAMQKLMLYEWPGNVRELENTIEYAVVMTRKTVITEDLILPTNGVRTGGPLKPLRRAKEEFEKTYLIRLLEACEGNVSKTARLAGKHRTDFYDLLKKYELDPAEFKKPKPV